MNYARVVLGGLVTGLILNIGEFLLNGVVLAKQMQEFFSRCGLPQPPSTAFIILIVITFVLGIVVMFIYASIRPRCGPGPKTAAYAGIIAWFCVYVYNNVVGGAIGFIPMNLVLTALVWGFFQYIIAAVAGAALYREP